jgi:hypothetical protein
MTETVQKKFEEYNVSELKAIAYDQLVILEQAQNNLKTINARIAQLSKPEKVEAELVE